jgi:hypothetical protein
MAPQLFTLVLLAGTHLVAHLLGLVGDAILTVTISIALLLGYCTFLALLPAVWPRRILRDTAARIEAMKTRLRDEAARRETAMEMHAILDGLPRLNE